jgi:hypothetical protein
MSSSPRHGHDHQDVELDDTNIALELDSTVDSAPVEASNKLSRYATIE